MLCLHGLKVVCSETALSYVVIFRRQSQRSFFGSTVGPIENLRALYLAKLSILPTRACFQLEIRKYLSTIINFPFFLPKMIFPSQFLRYFFRNFFVDFLDGNLNCGKLLLVIGKGFKKAYTFEVKRP